MLNLLGDELHLPAATGSAGTWVIDALTATPDAEGRLFERPLHFPCRRAIYWAPCQRVAINQKPDARIWPQGFNQAQGQVVADFTSIIEGGLFLVAELPSGEFLAVLPIAGPETVAWFCQVEGQLTLRAGTLGTAEFTGPLPLLAWACDTDFFAACERVWRLALDLPLLRQSARLRIAKQYPAMLEYLGWCSWEQYQDNITEPLLDDVFTLIEDSPIPIRYVLVDDGYLIHDADKRLQSISTHPEKFPHGLRPLTARRRPDKIRWMGKWICFPGFIGGIAAENEMGELNDYLMEVQPGVLQPKDDDTAALRFYDKLIGLARDEDFDFIKVDYQTSSLVHYKGTPHPVRCSARNLQAKELFAAHYFQGMINCIAHTSLCTFNTRNSAVTRCSEDYLRNNVWRAKFHIHNSFVNAPWLAQTVWCDHDMFHSSDKLAARAMAVTKAVSGGPIYLSDGPRDFQPELILPFCALDGKLWRALAPGTALPESLFADPWASPAPLKTLAPLTGGCVAFSAYNINENGAVSRGSFTASDYTQGGALLQNGPTRWPLPAGGLVLYDWFAHTLLRLDEKPWEFELQEMDCVLGLACPVVEGWALIGRADKYLAPQTLGFRDITRNSVTMELLESGPCLVYCATGTPRCTEAPVSPVAPGLWRIELPVAPGPRLLHLQLA
jgi:hypothetical protein